MIQLNPQKFLPQNAYTVHSTHSRNTAKKGFTLIELLVVIAIIAILAAILFPVFARARENARRSSCQSNLKQIALGVIQYTQDFDEKFPMFRVGNPAPNKPYGWADAIQPYLKSTQIYQCPSNNDVVPDPTSATPLGQQRGYTDYLYNSAIGSTPGSNPAVGEAIGLSSLENSTLTLLFLEGIAENTTAPINNGMARNASRGGPVTDAPIGAVSNIASQIHLEGCNLTFSDGHVKWFKGNGPLRLASVYGANAPFSVSGNSPTFHPFDGGTFNALYNNTN